MKPIKRIVSKETRDKMSASLKGLNTWSKGRRLSLETKQKLRQAALKNGNRPPVMIGKDNYNFGKDMSGENNSRWIKDRSKLQRYNDDAKDRRSSAYNVWRREVWLRDNFKCKIANPDCKGRIEAHHILGWVDHPELRYQTNNGITLCHAHHPRKRAEEKRLIPTFKELVSVSNKPN